MSPLPLSAFSPARQTGTTRLVMLLVALALLSWNARAQAAGEWTKCPDTAKFYETNNYDVRKVSIGLSYRLSRKFRKLFSLSGAQLFFDQTLKKAQAELADNGKGLTDGGKFRNLDGYIELQNALVTELSELKGKSRLTFTHLTPMLVNCDDVGKRLDVYYGVLSTEPFSYLTGVFEKRPDILRPSLIKGELLSKENAVSLTPMAGYNRTRDVFGGGALSVENRGGLIDKFTVGGTASDNSGTAGTLLSGSHDFDSGPIGYAEWNLGYDYSDVPADENKLKESTVLAQIFGATRAAGNQSLIVRFGTSLEGGNRQSSVVTVPSDSVVRSGYGALKAYVGANWAQKRQIWKVSYGLQAGAAEARLHADYFKHIGDFAYSVRFLPADHKPLRLDLQLTAGAIVGGSGRVPVAERFFGGNAEENFIRGDSWRIRANPFIRSFPQNRFSRVDVSGAPVGGDNFLSLSTTLAQTVWRKPLMPRDVLDDPEIMTTTGAELFTLRAALMDTYQEFLSGFPELRSHLLALEEPLQGLDGKLRTLRSQHPPSEAADAVRDALDAIEKNPYDDEKTTVQLAVEAVAKARKTPGDTLVSVRSLIVDRPLPALLTIISTGLPGLQGALEAEGHPDSYFAGILKKINDDTDVLWKQRKQVTNYYDAKKVADVVAELGTLPKPLDALTPEVQKFKEPARLALDELERRRAERLKQDPKSKDPELDKRIKLAELYLSRVTAVEYYLQETSSYVTEAQAYVKSSEEDEKMANDDIAAAKDDVDILCVGFGPAIPPLLEELADSLRKLGRELAAKGDAPTADQLAAEAESFVAHSARLRQGARAIAMPITEKKSQPTLLYAKRSLGALFREVNTVSISPFAMFDAARIGPRFGEDFGGVRYGVGGGVRFSLATLDVSLGYAVNPRPRAFESRGAFFFSMDVYDLFR